MNHEDASHFIAKMLGLAILLTMCTNIYAQKVRFLIAFEDVPGSAQLEQGKFKEGIQILQKELEKEDVDRGQVLSTLCGAYLLDKTFHHARLVCERAANAYPSKSSLNNYGIYLAATGDLDSAMKNFKRVQPLRRDQYIEYLRTKDIGLIALQNAAVIRDHQSGNRGEQSEIVTLSAKIEDLAK